MYEDIICLRALGRSVVVIGSAEVAFELLDKRSAKYSTRAKLNMVSLTGWDWSFPLMAYGQRWRDIRRSMWQHFRPQVVPKYQTRQQGGVHRLLFRLLSSPENLEEHLRYSVGGVILEVTYGLDVAEDDDENIAIFEKAFSSVDYLIPGSSLLEFFPLLARIPTWFPGTGTLRDLKAIREAATLMRDIPWAHAREARAAGKPAGIAGEMIDGLVHLNGDTIANEETAKDSAGIAYGAGLDTQYATLLRVFLGMALNPDAQRKAQAELDAVVGPTRLPNLSDRNALPYVNAVVRETLRWLSAGPTGIPHCTVEDDTGGIGLCNKSLHREHITFIDHMCSTCAAWAYWSYIVISCDS